MHGNVQGLLSASRGTHRDASGLALIAKSANLASDTFFRMSFYTDKPAGPEEPAGLDTSKKRRLQT